MINQHFNSCSFIMTTHEGQLKSLLINECLFIFRSRTKRHVFVLSSNASTLTQEIENI